MIWSIIFPDMKNFFALSASAAAIAISLGAATPAQAAPQKAKAAKIEKTEPGFFQKLFGARQDAGLSARAAYASDGSSLEVEASTTGTVPGPMPSSRVPTVKKNALNFLKKHGCSGGESIYLRVYKIDTPDLKSNDPYKKGAVDVYAQCGGANAPYKLLDTWVVTNSNGLMHKLGYKLYEDDNMIPEGMRTIPGVKDTTAWYLGINLGYPDALDRSRPIPEKVQKTDGTWFTPKGRGGLALFHGPYGSKGCVPLEIMHIELAYGIVDLASKNGAPIHIDVFPSYDMSPGNLKRLAAKPGNEKFLAGWLNMSKLDQVFQKTGMRHSIVPHGNAYAFAHDVPAPLIANLPAEIVKAQPQPNALALTTPEMPVSRTIPGVLPKSASEAIVPGFKPVQTSLNTSVTMDLKFQKTPVQKFNVVTAKPAQLAKEQLACMFALNAKCNKPEQKTGFVNPQTGETRQFVAGKGDSLRGFIPVTDKERLQEEQGVHIAFTRFKPH